MFTTVQDAINWIETSKKSSERRDLLRMEFCLKLLGNPELDYKKIHIAGTNGKGSTSAFIKNILLEAGFRVGTFISPYVVKFNERITYNYGYIKDDELIEYANAIKVVCEKAEEELGSIVSFFEILTLIAYKYFSDKKVEYAVIEVGLGGYLDPTNVINADVSLITNIGYDHMAQLGNTLEEIATNKLKIVKPHGYLITTADEIIMPTFYNYIADIDATVHHIDVKKIFVYDSEFVSFMYEDNIIDLSVIGIHQAYNATLAIETVKYLLPNISIKVIKKALLDTTWPGRLERVCLQPRILLDGAHNIHGINALVETVKRIYQNRHIIIIMSAMKDKETDKMIHCLEQLEPEFIFTDFDYYRCKKSQDLANDCRISCQVVPSFESAIRIAMQDASKNDVIIITGSLYFISLVRNHIKEVI